MVEKIEYAQLQTGFEFTPSVFTLDEGAIAAYIKATEDDNQLYHEKIVPPMAVVALAMAAMADRFLLLPGTVHVSQQLDFVNTAKVGDNITSYSRVNRKIVRGKFHMLNIGIKVVNSENQIIITGEVGFILPLEKSIAAV